MMFLYYKSEKFRQANEKDLLIAYYNKLTASGVSNEDFPWVVFLHHYQAGQAFAWYYAVFGGGGALANGERGLALCKCMLNRWVDAFRAWNGADAFKYNMARFKDRPTEPLTVEECVALLPEAVQAWVASDGSMAADSEEAGIPPKKKTVKLGGVRRPCPSLPSLPRVFCCTIHPVDPLVDTAR